MRAASRHGTPSLTQDVPMGGIIRIPPMESVLAHHWFNVPSERRRVSCLVIHMDARPSSF